MTTPKRAREWIESIMEEGPWYPRADDVVDFADVGEHDFVLDVGSGFGDITAEALDRGAKVISVDFSLKYLSKIALGISDTNPVLADGVYLPFRDSVFTRVISKAVWHNLTQADRRVMFVMEIGRVCAENGIVVLSAFWNRMYCYLNPKRLLFNRPIDDENHHYFTPSEVKSIFARARLKIIQIRGSRMPFRNELPLLNKLLPVWLHAFCLDVKALKHSGL